MENHPPSGSAVNGNAPAPPTESTVAQSFAADLDSMFGLSSGGVRAGGGGGADVDVLSQNVEEKKKEVSTGQSELEQLEAKLRETEQRLARVSRQNSPSRSAITPTAGALRGDGEPRHPHPFAQKPTFPADRPPTGQRQDTQQMMQGMPGAMPGTPREGREREREGEYVMLDDQGRGR